MIPAAVGHQLALFASLSWCSGQYIALELTPPVTDCHTSSQRLCAPVITLPFQKGCRRLLLQVTISAAGWMSSVPLASLTALHCGADSFTLALFDWQESRHAAEFCTLNVMQASALTIFLHYAWRLQFPALTYAMHAGIISKLAADQD